MGGLGEASMRDIPGDEVFESSRVGEVRGQASTEGERGLGAVSKGAALLNPLMGPNY